MMFQKSVLEMKVIAIIIIVIKSIYSVCRLVATRYMTWTHKKIVRAFVTNFITL